jgi:hypothetical protein
LWPGTVKQILHAGGRAPATCTNATIVLRSRYVDAAESSAMRLRTASMSMKQILGAALLLALSSGLAAAAPASLERSAKVRSAPGTGHQVLATLPRRAAVDVVSCSGGWCEIVWRGGQGYIAQALLALRGAPPAAVVAPAPGHADDYDYPGFDYPGYAYAPSTGVFVAPRWPHRSGRYGRHHRPAPGWAGRSYQPQAGGLPTSRTGERAGFGRAGGSQPAPAISGARATAGSSASAPTGAAAFPTASPAAPVQPLPAPSATVPPAAAAPAALGFR